MTSREFAYWLQSVFELGKVEELDEEQTEIIKRHINLVKYHEFGERPKYENISNSSPSDIDAVFRC